MWPKFQFFNQMFNIYTTLIVICKSISEVCWDFLSGIPSPNIYGNDVSELRMLLEEKNRKRSNNLFFF